MEVKILKDSLHPNGKDRFTTYLLNFPKSLLAELNTHRQLVRNVGSSRAIPVTKMIDKVLNELFVPIFSRNQKGMVGADTLTIKEQIAAHAIWKEASESAIASAERLNHLGIHKEVTNRLLEPFLSVDLVLSGTEFKHFFNLRDSPDTQKSFREIAAEMREQYEKATPDQLGYGDWHIPFDAYFPDKATLEEKLKIAIARCARISYQSHDGNHTTEKDFRLFDRLLTDKHMSPFEHVAKVVDNEKDINIGWSSYGLHGDSYTETLSLRNYLPPSIQKSLFYKNNQEFGWSRQYSGFYTYRSHLEDGEPIS